MLDCTGEIEATTFRSNNCIYYLLNVIYILRDYKCSFERSVLLEYNVAPKGNRILTFRGRYLKTAGSVYPFSCHHIAKEQNSQLHRRRNFKIQIKM